MVERAEKRGRKAQTASPGQRVSLGLKVTPDVKNKLDAEAKANGRTQSQEAELRIENSFRNRRLIDEALALAYGEKTAATLLLLAETIRQSSDHAAWIMALAGREEVWREDWLSEPDMFGIVARHLTRAIEALRPPGDVSAPLLDLDGQDLTVIFDKAGAANVLDAVIDPPNAVRQDLSVWAKPVAEKLGPDLVSRIRAKERAPGKTVGDQIAKLRSNR